MTVARGYEIGIVDAKVKLCNTVYKTVNAMSEVGRSAVGAFSHAS